MCVFINFNATGNTATNKAIAIVMLKLKAKRGFIRYLRKKRPPTAQTPTHGMPGLNTDEVTECHTITGSVEYLLRVEVADIKSYKKFHTDVLGTIPSISSITSFLVMDTTKNRYTNL